MRQSSRKKPAALPLILRWHEPANPFPVRVIRSTTASRPSPLFVGRPWAETEGRDQPFDFTAAVQRLLTDMIMRCPDFQHIQVPRILVSLTQARGGRWHGLQARVTPLRFPRGELTRQRRGVTYHIQRYFLDAQEFLYVLTFCLPRFQNQSFDQKFITLFHELYHIHPEFNGDLRRHKGRYQFHTRRQRDYNLGMVQYAREYLAGNPDPMLSDFLRMDFAQLQARHGSVTGIVVPRPKIIPLIGSHASAANVTTSENPEA
jgi:hypothetical protein